MAVAKVLMDIVRFLLTVTRPYSFAFLDFICRFFYGPKPELPPIDDGILLLPATELAEKIRKKLLRAEDAMKTYIGRIKEVEPLINACIDQRFEAALEEARNVDHFLSLHSKSEDEIAKDTPLLGVPFSCKETVGVKDLLQTCGIFAARERKAPEDGVATALYRKAGGIPVVVTNVPQFCSWWETANVPFGRTLNPYDNVRGAGGSTGGEGAILSYAGSVIGIGNDLAGSIRMPSAFNGIYGLKPSPGMISNTGSWPPDTENVDRFVGTGPMCRYATDLPLLSSILSESRIKFDKKVDFRKTRIYFMEQFPGYLFTPLPDIISAVRNAAQYFEDSYGNKPVAITIPELEYALEIWESKLLEAGIPPMKRAVCGDEKNVNLFLEFIKAVFNRSEHTLPALYYSAIERRTMDCDYYDFIDMFDSLKKKLDSILEGDAVLLLPTHPETAPHHLMTIPKYPNQAYTCIFNVLGYPSTQIPAGLSEGLPIGIQAICAINNDYVSVSTAVELEKCFGGWRSPCEVAPLSKISRDSQQLAAA